MLKYKWSKIYEAALYETNDLRMPGRITAATAVLNDRLSRLHRPENKPERDEAEKCSVNLLRLKARTC